MRVGEGLCERSTSAPYIWRGYSLKYWLTPQGDHNRVNYLSLSKFGKHTITLKQCVLPVPHLLPAGFASWVQPVTVFFFFFQKKHEHWKLLATANSLRNCYHVHPCHHRLTRERGCLEKETFDRTMYFFFSQKPDRSIVVSIRGEEEEAANE